MAFYGSYVKTHQGVDVITESQCNPGHVVCMSLPTRQCSFHEPPWKSMWHGNLTATEIYCSYNSLAQTIEGSSCMWLIIKWLGTRLLTLAHNQMEDESQCT